MWNIFTILICIGFSYGSPLTGPERINPSIEEINRCVPETMQEPIHQAIMKLPEVGKIVKELHELILGKFAQNARMLAMHLEALNAEELLNQENIITLFSDEDALTISIMLKDKNIGLRHFLNILKNLDLHLAGYVSGLHGMLNMGLKLDIIDLVHSIDLIQRGALELQEYFQLISYLQVAYDQIEGYETILKGMRHLLSFKIISMINSLTTMTEDLRSTFLSLLDKGDCNNDQIALALGLKQKKIQAIKSEDSVESPSG